MTNQDPTDTADRDDWTQVHGLLTTGASAHDDKGEVDLLRIGGHLLVVAGPPGRWRARHRRGLHRLGFRPMPPAQGARLVKWQWSVPAGFVDDELQRTSTPQQVLPAPGSLPASLRTWPAADALVRTQAVTVLREVFRVDPTSLQLLSPDQDGMWDDDEPDEPDEWHDDEADELSGEDPSSTCARCGRPAARPA